MANIMGFPPDFEFPDAVTEKQRRRLIGNSLNVEVVAALMREMTS